MGYVPEEQASPVLDRLQSLLIFMVSAAVWLFWTFAAFVRLPLTLLGSRVKNSLPPPPRK